MNNINAESGGIDRRAPIERSGGASPANKRELVVGRQFFPKKSEAQIVSFNTQVMSQNEKGIVIHVPCRVQIPASRPNFNSPGRSLRKDAHGRGGNDSVFNGEN